MAKQSTTMTTQEATPEQRAMIDKLRAALRPLAAISQKGPRVPEGHAPPEGYQLTRNRKTVTILLKEIEEARAVLADVETSIEELRTALKPLARLREDPRIEDPKAAVFQFTDDEGGPVPITNGMIAAAQELVMES